MNLFLILPVLIPLLTGVAALLAHRSRDAQRKINVSGMALLFVSAALLFTDVNRRGIVVEQIGGWEAPFGISFVADLLSAAMVLASSFIALAVSVYSLADIDPAREKYGYHQLYAFLVMGVNGAFLTGDLFNLYVWFEVTLMSSFVLLALGGEKKQIEGAFKYVALNLLASMIFLSALGLLYGLVGSLNMADVALKLAALNSNQTALVSSLAVLFLAAFGIKAAIFPLFFWLPASYHTPPAAVSAVFAGLLTKVGVYALLRVFTLLFIRETHFTHTVVLILAGLTMTTGVLGAVAQYDFRRLLAFHIVSQIGYMLMGLGIFTPLALAGAVFFTVHNMIVKTNLFLVSGAANKIYGEMNLKKLGGMYQSQPALTVFFLISALSLAGLPPLSGFVGKLALIRAGFEAEQYWVTGLSLAVSFFTLFSMMKIWNEAFWKPQPALEPLVEIERADWAALLAPMAAFALLAVLLGIGASAAFDVTLRAGEQLMNPALYIQAVMEGAQ